jgi:hypothetical protein
MSIISSYIEHGHTFFLHNGHLFKVIYANGNFVEKRDNGFWYRQDGSPYIVNGNSTFYYDANDILQKVVHSNGYIETFY